MLSKLYVSLFHVLILSFSLPPFQENLFQEGGRQAEMQQIINALDVGGARELPGSAHSMAGCLLLFLSALREPVIPVPLHQKAMDCCNQPMLCKQVRSSLNHSRGI